MIISSAIIFLKFEEELTILGTFIQVVSVLAEAYKAREVLRYLSLIVF